MQYSIPQVNNNLYQQFPQQSIPIPQSNIFPNQHISTNPSIDPTGSVNIINLQKSKTENSNMKPRDLDDLRQTIAFLPEQNIQIYKGNIKEIDENLEKNRSSLKFSRNKSPLKSNNLKNSFPYVDCNGNSFILDNGFVSQNIAPSSIKSELNYEISNDRNDCFKQLCSTSYAGRNADGNTKTCQDKYLVKKSISGIKGFNLFGVIDGHGQDGHYAAAFVRDYITQQVINFTEQLKNHGMNTAEKIYNYLKKENFIVLTRIYQSADKEISNQRFDSKLSGSTCNIVFQFGIHLVCANVGDSRGIFIKANDNRMITNPRIRPLNNDHKPNLPEEFERIQRKGGSVRGITTSNGVDLGGVYRVYIGNENYPGLAIARTIGDLVAKTCGVIPDPQFMEYNIDQNARYLVICSDGVWDVIQNEEVMTIGNQYFVNNDIKGHCQALLTTAVIRWGKYEGYRDDITVVVVYL